MTDDRNTRPNQHDEPDGATPATAVVVGGVGEEYAWVARRFPGAVRAAQMLQVIDGREFDVLVINTPDGATHEVFFDIRASFGKERPTADCPYCGQPLRTPMARQCRACGMDWHDAERPFNRRTTPADK